VRGAQPRELAGWLWDFDARPLTEAERAAASATQREAHTGFRGPLHKTDAFLEAHPFGTVPAAFSPDGAVGIFESNSILRAVGRLGEARRPLYGANAYSASRIDGFLDASLVFARDAQIYLLALGSGKIERSTHDSARGALRTYLGGIERALSPEREFLVGSDLTLADICFATEIALFSGERGSADLLHRLGLPLLLDDVSEAFPRALSHFERLCAHEAFAPDLGRYLSRWRDRATTA
jgi:elongation factor 1-gamma